MPNLILTDKGQEYYERLSQDDIIESSLEEGSVEMRKSRDWMILDIAKDGDLKDEGTSRGSTFGPVIRRLFEEGYIEYV